MGYQQVKVKDRIDLRKRAHIEGWTFTSGKTANYNVTAGTDSGKLLVFAPVNATHILFANLPKPSDANGDIYTFIVKAPGNFKISCIDRDVNGTMMMARGLTSCNIVNYVHPSNMASICQIYCDGVNFYHAHLGPLPDVVNTAHSVYTAHA